MSSPSRRGGPEAVDARRASSRSSCTIARAAPARCRRARAPPRRTAGARRWPGTRPFSSQAREEERPVDERHELAERDIRSTARGPRNDGAGRSSARPVDGQAVARAPGQRAAAACSARLRVLLAQLLLLARDWPRRTPAALGVLSRFDTTSTAREASSTCTTGWLYCRRDLHRRVLPAGRRAADQQRERRAAAAPSPSRRAPSRRATA